MSSVQLKVLTLNCWGVYIPVAVKYKDKRINAIAEELAKGEYDIVLLQEIWQQKDYVLLCEKLVDAFPHSHYFHSGNYGSGVCIFSKHVIYDVAQYAFTLNGYPHRIFCGDWFGRKAVGLAKILVGELKVNAYATHLHAQYKEADEFEAHRLSQCFEMSQFIRHTSDGCDVVIVGGDLNHCPDQLGYSVITHCGNLTDTMQRPLALKDGEGNSLTSKHEITFNRLDNTFYDPSDWGSCGQTLDYLLYRQHSGHTVECSKCYITMQKIPGLGYNYSDHEGLAAILDIKRNVTAFPKQRDHAEIEKTLTAVLPIIDSGMRKVKSTRIFYIAMATLLLFVLLFLVNSGILGGLPRLVEFVCEGFLLLAGVLCLLITVFWSGREYSGLLAVKKSINVQLRSLHMD